MSRVKSFDATGIAPNGKLYAGDLNAIQDHYADLSNFTQTVDVSTLRVGDGALQLLKYGAGEFRMTGALRTDGILRPLGGLLLGSFTTAARDAIAVGLAPNGVQILNTDLNQIQWNFGTDGARDWRAIGAVSSGAFSSMPAAGTAGRQYFDTINKIVWVDTGTKWIPQDGAYPGMEMDYSGVVSGLTGIVEVFPHWLLENAVSLVRVAPYDDLFANVGTAYGFADGTHFNLPEGRGKVSVPAATSGTFVTRGATGGEETHVLTTGEMPVHSHGHGAGDPVAGYAPGAGNAVQSTQQTDNAGGGAAHNNLQPYVVKGARLIRY